MKEIRSISEERAAIKWRKTRSALVPAFGALHEIVRSACTEASNSATPPCDNTPYGEWSKAITWTFRTVFLRRILAERENPNSPFGRVQPDREQRRSTVILLPDHAIGFALRSAKADGHLQTAGNDDREERVSPEKKAFLEGKALIEGNEIAPVFIAVHRLNATKPPYTAPGGIFLLDPVGPNDVRAIDEVLDPLQLGGEDEVARLRSLRGRDERDRAAKEYLVARMRTQKVAFSS